MLSLQTQQDERYNKGHLAVTRLSAQGWANYLVATSGHAPYFLWLAGHNECPGAHGLTASAAQSSNTLCRLGCSMVSWTVKAIIPGYDYYSKLVVP